MIILMFDNTFEGLLTAIYHGCRINEPIRIKSKVNYQAALFDNLRYIDTDISLQEKVEDAIVKRCGHDCLMVMYKAFLSEVPEIHDYLFIFFKKAMKFKNEVLFMHADKDILTVLNAQKKASRESHFLKGALRFKQSKEDLLYACYSPSSNVTSLISAHFTERLKDYNWIIHDIRRNIYAFYNKKECIIGHFTETPGIAWKDISFDYEDLWRTYHEHASIKERENKKLQISHMPLKYWQYLTEKQ